MVKSIQALLRYGEAVAGKDVGSRTLAARRVQLKKHVKPEILIHYDRFCETAKPQPLATLVGAYCTGCNWRLPTLVESKLNAAVELTTCPHCSRILYLAEWVGQKTEEIK